MRSQNREEKAYEQSEEKAAHVTPPSKTQPDLLEKCFASHWVWQKVIKEVTPQPEKTCEGQGRASGLFSRLRVFPSPPSLKARDI